MIRYFFYSENVCPGGVQPTGRTCYTSCPSGQTCNSGVCCPQQQISRLPFLQSLSFVSTIDQKLRIKINYLRLDHVVEVINSEWNNLCLNANEYQTVAILSRRSMVNWSVHFQASLSFVEHRSTLNYPLYSATLFCLIKKNCWCTSIDLFWTYTGWNLQLLHMKLILCCLILLQIILHQN